MNRTTNITERAWYGASIGEFLLAKPDTVVGTLTRNGRFDQTVELTDSWLAEVAILQGALKGLSGMILLEYNIPRLGSRADAVLLVGPSVIVVEFKVGQSRIEKSSREQVWDYALDLKNFHECSHSAPIVPILVATNAKISGPPSLRAHHDGVYQPIETNSSQLRSVIDVISSSISGKSLNPEKWSTAPYHPTPTIIEAARALYSNHSVEAIARHDAGTKNLGITTRRLEEFVVEAQREEKKIICFVTGVPGAGKTLVGLNIATQRRDDAKSAHAVFLSGNGPLVKVLHEALTRDELDRLRSEGIKRRKGEVASSVKPFIQNVHHFRDEGLVDPRPPYDHIAIFDEAQRAWNLKKTSGFMSRKKGRAGFSQSEPEFLISCLDRHSDWAAILCLVGGGQEISDGEAGIGIWLEAIEAQFPHWHTFISSRLTDSEYNCGEELAPLQARGNVHFDDDLHLGVSMRSFRAENVSNFVKCLLDCDAKAAKDHLKSFVKQYPIILTRDLESAKNWIRTCARGSERYGLVASSAAQRLKPHAIDVRVKVNPIHWFLNGKSDTRSSFYLEDAATEFQIQGLEVDWALVTWDADLRFKESGWSFHEFRGSNWRNIRQDDRQRYLLNAYRVLLTRARQGMVIFIPEGCSTDPTRAPEYYDHTYHYLADIGIPRLT